MKNKFNYAFQTEFPYRITNILECEFYLLELMVSTKLYTSQCPSNVDMGACGPVDRVLDSRSEALGFDSQCWPCLEVSDKLCIPHCLGPPSRNRYLVHRSKVGSIVAGCIGAHHARGKVKSVNMRCHGVWTLKQLPLPLPVDSLSVSNELRLLVFC